MVKENENINSVIREDLKGYNSFHFINCIINTVDLAGAFELKVHLAIENCIISNLRIHSCWFVNGLVIKNCIIKDSVDYQMGGHNIDPILIEGNVFINFFNFFDCQFENLLLLKNNIFSKGTNLLGNKDEGFANTFVTGCVIEDNVGSVDIDGVFM